MKQVAPGVHLLEGLRGSNVYALEARGGIALIDSGMSGAADQIVAQLAEGGYALSDLQAVVLTHAHGDHTGNAAELARRSEAQIMAQRDEVPYIEGVDSLPPASFLQRVLLWLERRIMSGPPSCRVTRALEDGETIEELGGLQVIHTPGHTPGSLCLYQAERRILFCGDALFNANPLTGRPGLQLPIRLVTLDNAQARNSVVKLSTLAVEMLCCGHGEPILDGAGGKIRALLREENS